MIRFHEAFDRSREVVTRGVRAGKEKAKKAHHATRERIKDPETRKRLREHAKTGGEVIRLTVNAAILAAELRGAIPGGRKNVGRILRLGAEAGALAAQVRKTLHASRAKPESLRQETPPELDTTGLQTPGADAVQEPLPRSEDDRLAETLGMPAQIWLRVVSQGDLGERVRALPEEALLFYGSRPFAEKRMLYKGMQEEQRFAGMTIRPKEAFIENKVKMGPIKKDATKLVKRFAPLLKKQLSPEEFALFEQAMEMVPRLSQDERRTFVDLLEAEVKARSA